MIWKYKAKLHTTNKWRELYKGSSPADARVHGCLRLEFSYLASGNNILFCERMSVLIWMLQLLFQKLEIVVAHIIS